MIRLLTIAAAVTLAGGTATAAPHAARNVILFIGDGMGVSTLTAARIYAGDRGGTDGAPRPLSFERLPNTALSRTYSADNLVTDSAAGAMAMLAGEKVNNETLGLTAAARLGRCDEGLRTRLTGLAERAATEGRAVGLVTDARVTDATPGAMYGHSPSRHWETPADLPAEAAAAGCTALSDQLGAALDTGRLRLAFGGGTLALPAMPAAHTADELSALKPGAERSYRGLFAPRDFPYVLDRPASNGPPSLTAMAIKAVELLGGEQRGYFLLIEAGLIDKAHHLNDARRALAETLELSDAVSAVLQKVDLSETLVIVTADHSHGLTLSAPAARDASILGLARSHGRPALAADGHPYGVLSYATGPGDRQPALVRLPEAEHSGEDVAVFAAGPGSDKIHGAMENTDLFEIMRSALGLPQ